MSNTVFMTWSDWHTTTENLSAKQFWALMDRNLTASNQVVRATTCWHRELDRIMEF